MVTEWITQAEAARIIGCSVNVVERLASAGRIRRRWPPGRKTPTIDRASAEGFRAWWQEYQAGIQRQRRERLERMALAGPPSDGEVWLDTTTAALVIGVSSQYLGRLALQDRIPATRRGLFWWFRRRDVEQYAAARVLSRRGPVAEPNMTPCEPHPVRDPMLTRG